MSAPENPFAFPFPEIRDADGCGIMKGSQGMSLRDWFAGQAFAQIVAGDLNSGEPSVGPANIAAAAYVLADAMLTARTDTGRGGGK